MKLRGLSKIEKAVIQREWDGKEVVDAKEDLRLFISKEDIESATRKDASCCALANCCKRSIGSEGVFFYKTIAYVHIPTSNQVQRFFLSGPAMKLVEAFDKGKAIPAQEVVLRKVPEDKTLDSELQRSRWRARSRAGKKGDKKHDRTLPGARTKNIKASRPVANNMVRSGVGKANFTVGSATGKAAK